MRKWKSAISGSVVFLIVVLSGCKLGEPYSRVSPVEKDGFRLEKDSVSSIADLPWWELFRDTVLQGLIEEGIQNNLDLNIALRRIEEAQAQLGIVRANLYPKITYGLDGSTVLAQDPPPDDRLTGTAFTAVAYQVDLWGRFRNLSEAARQEYQATEEDYRSLIIIIGSNIAQSYLLLRDLDNRLIIAEQTLEVWENNIDIIQARFDAGIISEVDLKQSEILVEDAVALIQGFRRLRVQTENSLSLLLGKPPQDIGRGQPLTDQTFPVEVPEGLPSELLDRRPDILASERRLEAQTARIGAAQALLYPSLTLSADMGALFTSGTSIFSNLSGQLLGPIFNANANRRRVEIERIRTNQLMTVYQSTFLNALREVEDAMIAVDTYALEYQARNRQVGFATEALNLSWVRYQNGVTSYLEILDLQRSQFNAMLRASEALQLKYTSMVRLYEALGGGWTPPTN